MVGSWRGRPEEIVLLPPFHLESSGIIFVAFGLVKAGGRCVIAVTAEAVRPAIIHLAALDSDVAGRGWSDRRGRGDSGGRRG